MLYHGAQKVKLPNLSKISRLLSPLAIFLRFLAFQRYMISDVVFWWKVTSNFGHFAAALYTSEKSKGPNTEPCGTPLGTSHSPDVLPPHTTLCEHPQINNDVFWSQFEIIFN